MATQDDGLFLLEVLIDKIVYSKSPCFSDKGFRTCVSIQCPACDPLVICDDDPGTNRVTADDSPFIKSFNNGKSCLFSLKQSDISTAMSKFPIKVSIYKELPCGCLPSKINLGEATIDMTKEFVQARKTFLEDPSNVSYEALKDSFHVMGPDGGEAGEILMFLRISCFGKWIVTRFQGGGAPPMIGSGMGGSESVDRSCNPPRAFQSRDDPCACGASRGGGGGGSAGGSHGGAGGVCEPARDPYDSKPCEDPDDPCYCSGPKADPKQQMACRNTQQYCLHVPKGAPLTTTLRQRSSEDQKLLDMPGWQDPLDLVKHYFITRYKYRKPDIMSAYASAGKLNPYIATGSTTRKMTHSVSFIDTYVTSKYNNRNCYSTNVPSPYGLEFGKKKTLVYVTLYDQFCRHRTSGTQATASLNKSFQASPEHSVQYQPSLLAMSSGGCSTCSTSTADYTTNKCYDPRGLQCSEMYFFSKKRDRNVTRNMNQDEELVKVYRPNKSVQAQSGKTSTSVQTAKRPASSSLGTATSKAVSIKEPDKGSSLTSCGNTNNVPTASLTATVSHIRIAPPSSCGVYGTNPCQGPNCVLMGLGGSDAPSSGATPNSSSEQKVPVKVTTANNPRRGVFELVIRRIGGAPLAKNELMLEWIPPPARPPCNVPCPLVCPSPARPCRPVKCRPVFRASKPRCCRKPLRCKLPCGPKLSRCAPCDLCGRVSCPGQSPCSPCIPRSCSKPCLTPCPRPCPRPCKPRKSCKPCKPCKPCHPPFPFKPTGCTLCCAYAAPCSKPCNPPPCKPPKRPCKPCRRCKPPPRRPCRPCFPYRPCVPDLACPLSKTSIVFCPSKSKICKPCDSCCSPFPSCFSCYTCIPLSPCTPCPPSPAYTPCTPCPTYTPCPPFPSLPCNIRSHCLSDQSNCNNPCNPLNFCIASTCTPCKLCKLRCFKPYKICRASRRRCGRCKRCRSCRPKPCKPEPPPECCEEEFPCPLPENPCPVKASCSTDTSTCVTSCSTPCVRSCK